MRILNIIRRLPLSRISYRGYSESSEAPVKYTTSKASSWKAEYSRQGHGEDESAWFQPYVVSSSVGIFLYYFCILREESDIDQQLGKSLYDRIDGLEEVHLKTALKYNMEHGLDTKQIVARLKEIEKEKQMKTKID